MNRLEFFSEELNKISNDNLRDFTKEVINSADDYFFFIPASTTGKHHPPFDQSLGGLVRHSKVVAYMAHSLGIANKISQDSLDILIVAAIAHDIKKIGTGASGHTMKNHPELAAEFVRKISEAKDWGIEETIIDQICDCILCHMGQWGKNEPNTQLELILHSADYIASRHELQGFDFGNIPSIEEKEIGEVIIPFGKHKGITIKELCEKQPGYVRWIRESNDFFNPTYKELILTYYKSTESKINFNL